MLNPAEAIIEKCGGHAVVATICKVHITRVFRWSYPRERGGSGGLIPARHQVQLLAGARDRGIALSPDDFFPRMPDDPASPGLADDNCDQTGVAA